MDVTTLVTVDVFGTTRSVVVLSEKEIVVSGTMIVNVSFLGFDLDRN